MSVATKSPRSRTDDRAPRANADADTVQRVSQAILKAVFTKAAPEPTESNDALVAASSRRSRSTGRPRRHARRLRRRSRST